MYLKEKSSRAGAVGARARARLEARRLGLLKGSERIATQITLKWVILHIFTVVTPGLGNTRSAYSAGPKGSEARSMNIAFKNVAAVAHRLASAVRVDSQSSKFQHCRTIAL